MAEKLRNIVCLHCGGEVVISEDGKTATCKYCRKTYKIGSSLSDGATIDFALATEYWKTFRFADAKRKFLDVTKDDKDFAEAYWGAVVSEYGIEWGENRFGETVPTCHRAHAVSVYDDANYKKAVKLSGDEKYKDLANKIEEVRKEIIEKSSEEKDYDVFICFKATEQIDGRTRKTDDFELGREIYNELTEHGYKVFFSPETLMRVKEQEFEPYIFKALSTARVMLLLCSDNEKIESPWVKNEWGRFLDMKNGSGLIPVCGNKYEPFSPAMLPNELRKLNAIEFGAKLFTQINSKLDAYFPEKVKERELAEKKKQEELAKEKYSREKEEQERKFKEEREEQERKFREEREAQEKRFKELEELIKASRTNVGGGENKPVSASPSVGKNADYDNKSELKSNSTAEKTVYKIIKNSDLKNMSEEERLKIKAESGDPKSQFELGLKLYETYNDPDRYVKAKEWWQKSAEQGYVRAQCSMGSLYYNGYGVEKDLEKALEYYLPASTKNDPIARKYVFEIKNKLAEGKAKPEKEKAKAEQNDKTARINRLKAELKAYESVNKSDLKGEKYTEYMEKTVSLLTELEMLGDSDAKIRLPRAQYSLGLSYANTKNYAKAFEAYNNSAENGWGDAFVSLGQMYSMGDGVKADQKKAVECYEKAVALGDADGLYSLGVAYSLGLGVEKDNVKALELLEKADKKGFDCKNYIATVKESIEAEAKRNESEEKLEAFKNYVATAKESIAKNKEELAKLEMRQKEIELEKAEAKKKEGEEKLKAFEQELANKTVIEDADVVKHDDMAWGKRESVKSANGKFTTYKGGNPGIYDYFSLFKNAQKIILPKSVEKIEKGTFDKCEKLEILDLSKTQIKDFSFLTSNLKIKELNLPCLDLNFDPTVLRNLSELKEITVVEDPLWKVAYGQLIKKEKGGAVLFYPPKKEDKSVFLGYKAGDFAFAGNKFIEEVSTHKTSNIAIGKGAFKGCENLKTLRMNFGEIGERAFENCCRLQEVYIDGYCRILSSAFKDCKNLISVTVNNYYVEVYPSAFWDCVSLKFVEFDAKNVIYTDAFCGCKSLAEVVIKTGTTIEKDAFKDTAIKHVEIPKKCKVDRHAFPSDCKVKKPLFG